VNSFPPEPSWHETQAGRIGIVVVVAAVAAALVYFLLIKEDEDSGGTRASGADISAGEGAVEVTEGDLAGLAGKVDFPVFWAGDQGQERLELTRTTDDRVFIRYLDDGAKLGTSDPDYLTVGTYPLKDAYKALEEQSAEEGAVVEDTPDGGLVVTNESAPTSVYIAFEDEDYQIEVFDPDPDLALDLATSGQIEPVD
jgi:hypothetical protein